MSIIFEFMLLGLFAAGLIYLFMFLKARMPGNKLYKYATILALSATFLLFWVNGAVGIIGSEDNDANMLFFGVIAIGFIGAILSGFKPVGMSRAMFAAGCAQVAIGVTALAAGWGSTANMWPKDVIGATLFFSFFWFGSWALYHKAGEDQQVKTV